MEEFKGNPQSTKKDKEKKDISPVTSNVIVKKENELSKFKKQFFAEDAKSVKGHIFLNVVVPGLQRLMTDIVKNGIDWMIYGTKGGSRTTGGARNISYTSYYDRNRAKPRTASPTRTKPSLYSLNEVIFPDRGEAEQTLLRLEENVDRYGMVSAADFYDLINQKHSYTDNKYGWKSLETAEVVRNHDGYSIKFPTIKPIE